MGNFMCQLDWSEGCPDSSKTLFPGMSVRISPEEISMRINPLSKEDTFTNSREHYGDESLNRTKRGRKSEFAPFA